MSVRPDAIAAVPLFHGLPKKTLSRIAECFEPRAYEAGAHIFQQGKEGTGFFLIASGRVQISRDGTELATLGEGEFFGEMALLLDHIRSASATAVAPTQCYTLSRWDFLAELKKSPEMAVEMLTVLSARLRTLDDRLSRL